MRSTRRPPALRSSATISLPGLRLSSMAATAASMTTAHRHGNMPRSCMTSRIRSAPAKPRRHLAARNVRSDGHAAAARAAWGHDSDLTSRLCGKTGRARALSRGATRASTSGQSNDLAEVVDSDTARIGTYLAFKIVQRLRCVHLTGRRAVMPTTARRSLDRGRAGQARFDALVANLTAPRARSTSPCCGLAIRHQQHTRQDAR